MQIWQAVSGSCLPAPACAEEPRLLNPAVTQAHGGGPCALSNQGRISGRWVGHCKAQACTFLLTDASVVLVSRVPSMVPGGSSAGFLTSFVTVTCTCRGDRWKDSGRPRKPGNGECVGSGAEAGTRGWFETGGTGGGGTGLSAVTSGVCGPRSTGGSAGTSVHPARSVGAEPAAGTPDVLCSHCGRRLGPGASPGSCARAALRLPRWYGDDGVGPEETIVTQ